MVIIGVEEDLMLDYDDPKLLISDIIENVLLNGRRVRK